MDEERLRARCGELIETILQDYSAFQVQTIDSFMARIFRASALEFGFSPTLEIKPDSRLLLDVAFEQFARELATDPSKRLLLEQLTDILVESRQTDSRYVWNPFERLSNKIRELYSTLSAQSKTIIPSSSKSLSLTVIRKEILDKVDKLRALVKGSGLEITKNFETVLEVAATGDVDDLIGRKSLYNLPVKKSGGGKIKQKAEELDLQLKPLQEQIGELASKYIIEQAYSYYRPYVEAHTVLRDTIEQAMRRSGQISLSDVNRALLTYISEETVPQIYFYLGEAVFHYLIDEFQDTSPMQWETMKPLLAEALSKQGSLFVVGDTKQSIYAFRHADWRIMKSVMEKNIFPSAPPDVRKLETNYRSFEKIIDFSKNVFHEIVPREVEGDAPHASGLSSFKQEVDDKNKKKGYVEVVSFEKNEESEREKILEIVKDCIYRGHHYNDIMILTPQNKHVIAVSGWLNSAQIKFISHSSLDIRGQSIIGEILSLLRFLDSPIDDLAFATFLLSNIFDRILKIDDIQLNKEKLHTFLIQTKKINRSAPLYTIFRKQFTDVWKKYFDTLFNVVGYLPIYDLVSEIYKQFNLFKLVPDEQATLVKLLEVMKDFEETGQNTLKDFLAFADEEGDDTGWNIAIPHGEDAISVMTIHKAKGLDKRVVILLFMDSKPRTDNLFIEEGEEGVRLVHINKKNTEYDELLKELYDRRKFESAVDNLNKLYVAFTRAQEEMYIISVKDEKLGEPSRFLPKTGYEPSKKPKVDIKDKTPEQVAELQHSIVPVLPEISSPEKLALYERRRGEAIHDVLSRVKYVDVEIERHISSAVQEIAGSWLELADSLRMKALILEFLRLPDIQPFFVEEVGRFVLNEQEFVTSQGRLFRMDRIIVDVDNITVLDFKTGDDKENYRIQVQDYMAVLQDFYPGRAIHGVLAFVDRKNIRVIT
jgi:ATP-dependent exoDNAse (exonuclease V) beta subunit